MILLRADDDFLSAPGGLPSTRTAWPRTSAPYPVPVRLTDFWQRMERRFGPAYAESIARDQVLRMLDGRTVSEALAAGEDAKRVWLAVCDAFEVPVGQR